MWIYIYGRQTRVWRGIKFTDADLKDTEDKIKDLKSSMGMVVPIQQEEEAFKQQQGQIEQEYRMAAADLKEDMARSNQLWSLLPGTQPSAVHQCRRRASDSRAFRRNPERVSGSQEAINGASSQTIGYREPLHVQQSAVSD